MPSQKVYRWTHSEEGGPGIHPPGRGDQFAADLIPPNELLILNSVLEAPIGGGSV